MDKLALFTLLTLISASVPASVADEPWWEQGSTDESKHIPDWMRHPCARYVSLAACASALDGTCLWRHNKLRCVESKALTSILDTSSPWDNEIAAMQIQRDITQLIAAYESKENRDILKDIVHDFIESRNKTSGVRKLAKWGKSVGLLLEKLPSEALGDNRAKLMEIGNEVAKMLIEAHVTDHSYVEDTVMRGWPLFRKDYTRYPVHEAFNSGFIGQAVALAALNEAKSGNHLAAVNLLKPVLEHLYDNFLDQDPRKQKLDSKGRYVLVPKHAPEDRHQRYLDVNDFSICLGEPSMYNHGTVSAEAAIKTLTAIDAINWAAKGVVWPLPECPFEACKLRLAAYVRKTGKWMKSAFELQGSDYPLTGEDPARDKYPGADGTPWYTWKYRDVSTCKDPRAPLIDPTGVRPAEFLDRVQDFQHATHEMEFIHNFMAWAQSANIPEVFTNEDIARLIVTFLNRGVYNYSASSQDDLFACDVEGAISGKACHGSRGPKNRSQAAPHWLVLALAAKFHGAIDKSNQVACDVYRMVETVLPLALGPWGDRFDQKNFGTISGDWGADVILAKYYFYNFHYGIDEHCREVAVSAAGPITKKPQNLPDGYIKQEISQEDNLQQENLQQETLQENNLQQEIFPQEDTFNIQEWLKSIPVAQEPQEPQEPEILQEDNLKQDNLTESNLKEKNVLQGNIQEGSLQENNLKEGSIQEDKLKQDNLQENNLEQDNMFDVQEWLQFISAPETP